MTSSWSTPSLRHAMKGEGPISSLVTTDRTQGKENEATLRGVQFDVRKRLFTESVAGYWNRIPRKVFMAASL